jgi:hypothetical protein
MTPPVQLTAMTPAQAEGWRVLFALYDAMPSGWCLIGGQMTWLLAHEHGSEPLRATEDVDVAVDIRADQAALTRMCQWLESAGFELESISSDGIGHRYVLVGFPGPGRVMFDVLAPDNLGSRANLTTTPPARTVSAPGTSTALETAEAITVILPDRSQGQVQRPTLLAAILAKAAATTIAVRSNPERDWSDTALLLTLIPDPIKMAAQLRKGDRRRLRNVERLLDRKHPAWRPLGSRAADGIEALGFLIGT